MTPVMKSSRFHLGKSATSVDASGRCGEMADAQDLKSCYSQFYRVLLCFIQVAFSPVNIGEKLSFLCFARPGGFNGKSSTNGSTTGFCMSLTGNKTIED